MQTQNNFQNILQLSHAQSKYWNEQKSISGLCISGNFMAKLVFYSFGEKYDFLENVWSRHLFLFYF